MATSGSWNVDCTTGLYGQDSGARFQLQFSWYQSFIKGGASSTITVDAKLVCTTFKYAVNASWWKDGQGAISISAGGRTLGSWEASTQLTTTALTYQGQVLWSGSVEFTLNTTSASSFSISIAGGLFVNTGSNSNSITFPTTSSTQYTDSIPQKRTLYISEGTGTWISVTRNNMALGNGAILYDGDVLYVKAGTNAGYGLSTFRNGTYDLNSSGAYITISSDCSLSATAYVLSYSLYLNAATGTNISVYRTASPKAGSTIGFLYNGSTIYFDDGLTVSYAADAGWEVTSFTVNGSDFQNGETLTVSNNITVVTTGKQLGLAYIGNGSSNEKYLVYIGNGIGYDMYIPYIGDGSRWNLLS